MDETMYPTVFNSLGYKKPSKTRKSPTKKSHKTKNSPKTKKSPNKKSPKTRKASPKMITILRPDGEVFKLPSTIKTIIGAKRQIEQEYGIHVKEQTIFSENSEMPLENSTDILEDLGMLLLVITVPPPPEFSDLDNTTTDNQTTNLRRITMKILIDHIDDEGLTFTQLFDKVDEYNSLTNWIKQADASTMCRPLESVAVRQKARKRLFTTVLEPFMKQGFIKMEFDETLFPARLNPVASSAPRFGYTLWELRNKSHRDTLTMRKMLMSSGSFTAVLRPAILNVIRITLNKEHPYVATLF